MKPTQVLAVALLLLFIPVQGWAQPPTDAESRAAWTKLQRQALTETTFRQACDFIQDIGQTNLNLAYTLLAGYVPRVQKTGNQRWTHILLINWGKANESLNHFDEAEPLFRQARQNAKSNPRFYADALTYTAQLYFDWDKPDSLAHYLALGEQAARTAHDRENLSLQRSIRAASRSRLGQTGAMRADYDEAIRLATGLPNKNAIFIARYSRASDYLTNPQQQVMAFDSLLELANDSTLARSPRFYKRTTVYYRRAEPTLFFKLAQLNLLLTDYDNAGKFADLCYDRLIRPNPRAPNVPYFNTEMAIIRVYQGQIPQARAFMDSSRRQFGVSEAQIPYSGYFLAAGLLAEHDKQFTKAADYYRQALTKGVTSASFSAIPPELFYVRALLRIGQYDKARQVLNPLTAAATANRFSAIGLYYYQSLAELNKAQGDYLRYGQALGTYYAIRDSLTNLNQYRAVQQILAKVRIRDKEQQIDRLNAENTARLVQLRRERWFYGAIITLAVLAIGLLMLYIRNRQVRARQHEALQQSHLKQLEKQRHIDLMQGVMEAEANERRKIADQLHDEVNSMLALATLNVSSVLDKGPDDAHNGQKLIKTQAVLTSVSTTVRDISHRLTPLLIERYGFRYAIEDLTETVNLSERLQLDTSIVGFNEPALYPLSFLNELYRIIQELVHNIIKHAHATQATVEVVEHEHHVTLMIDDNGVGISSKTQRDGMGLSAIRSRVAYLNGQMEIQRKPKGGTMVVIDNLALPEPTAELARFIK